MATKKSITEAADLEQKVGNIGDTLNVKKLPLANGDKISNIRVYNYLVANIGTDAFKANVFSAIDSEKEKKK